VIQLPIFIALYALLDTTIALRGAVFIPKWIEDLSHPDPYFILPLLMGGVMFLQQKLQYKTQTPSEQRMMMYFMPLFLTFIFLRFPSGLVLYYFMYNVFSFLGTGVMKKIEKGGRK
jgi:YidC/Oxa1 family membrane protein insertase